MKRGLPWWGCIAISFIAFSCAKDHGHQGKPHTVRIEDVPDDIRIPRALWEALEGKSVGTASHVKAPEEEHGESAAHGSSDGESLVSEEEGGLLFMPVTVILREKNRGVLSHPSLQIELPRGGGLVDLASYTTGMPGSFYVDFTWPEAGEKIEDLQIWFDSRARRRKLDDGLWGNGCGVFMNITRGFFLESKKGGLKVNTTRDRHLTVLGGHFLFSYKKEGQVFVGQVTFKDSLKQVLYCEGF